MGRVVGLRQGPSRTAILAAAARALHCEEPPPRVLDDPIGLQLAGEEGLRVTARLQAALPREGLVGFSRWVCVRSRLPEDVVERAMVDGTRQYVILGAGLDSFAYRRTDLVDRLNIFEVDHPATQAWKRARLSELAIGIPPNLVFAPVDFEAQTLREGLEAAAFDFAAPAVFSWLGVTMYLTIDAIEATLRTVADCPAGSRIVFTYDIPLAALEGLGLTTRAALTQIMTEMGEPFVTHLQSVDVDRLLRKLGFDEIVHFGPAEAAETYFPGRTDVHFGGAQRLAMARVGQAPT